MFRKRRFALAEIIPLIILLLGICLLIGGLGSRIWNAATRPAPTSTVEPIIPTITPVPTELLTAETLATDTTPTDPPPTATLQPTVAIQPTAIVTSSGLSVEQFGRIGISGAQSHGAGKRGKLICAGHTCSTGNLYATMACRLR